MHVKPITPKSAGAVFAIAACGQVAAAVCLLYVLYPNHSVASSPNAIEALAALLAPALIAGLCALVLLTSLHPSRRALIALLAICIATCACLLLAGWGLLAVVLAAPTVLLAFLLRRIHA